MHKYRGSEPKSKTYPRVRVAKYLLTHKDKEHWVSGVADRLELLRPTVHGVFWAMESWKWIECTGQGPGERGVRVYYMVTRLGSLELTKYIKEASERYEVN